MSLPAPRLFPRLIPLLTLMLIMTGCSVLGGGERTESAAAPQPGQPARPTPGSRIVEGGVAEPRTLNPIFVADPTSEELSHLVFNGLVLVHPGSGEPTPDLAASWDVSEDRLTYTFHIRDGILWHDGQSFTAHDVVFTYQLMMDNRIRSPRYSMLSERIRGVSSPDRSTVMFTLRNPDAAFLTEVATLGIVPEHVLSPVLPEELVTDPFGLSSVVGTGPFTLQQWSRGDQIQLRWNERYFKGPVGVETYTYRVLSSSDELFDGLGDGSIDWGRVEPALADEASSIDGVRVESLPGYEMSYVALQLDPDQTRIFLDDRVRQALMFALDREQAVTEIWHDHAQVADGTQPSASAAFAPSETVYRQDLDKARRLLDEAGWIPGADGVRQKDGQRLRFTLSTNGDDPVRKQVADWLIQSWRAIGVEAVPNFEKWSTIREQVVKNRDFEALLLGFRWGIDPDQSIVWSSDSLYDAFNLGNYSNDQLDDLLDQAAASGDIEERQQRYAQVQNAIMTDLPALPLVFPNTTVALTERLEDVEVTAIFMRNRAFTELWQPTASA
jgi:peptide/nickel transport system substrate-binding protein